jgi:hypothetical protein
MLDYLDFTPFHWAHIQQSPDEVVYRLRNNPFIEAVITAEGLRFVGYDVFTDDPEQDINEDARQEALALSRRLSSS